MLEGVRFDAEGTQRVEGQDNLPSVQLVFFTNNEQPSAGAPAAARRLKNEPLEAALTFTFAVRSNTRTGWFVRSRADGSGDVPARDLGLLELLSLVQDAMETAVDGTVDAGLSATVEMPIQFSVQETDPGQVSNCAFLEVVVIPRHFCRGRRSGDSV